MLLLSTLGYREYWIFTVEPTTSHAHWSHTSTSPLKYLSCGIDDLCIVSAFLLCHHFRDKQKKLTFCAGFCSKSLHSPLTMFSERNLYLPRSQPKDKTINQTGTWSFADTFRTSEETNVISLWSDDSMKLHFWDTSDALESRKSSLVSVWSVRFFTTQCKEDP